MKHLGLIGRKLGHSFSAKYFTEKFEREALVGEFEYALYELSEIEQVEDFIGSMPDLLGFNVTIPYKQQIIPYLDELSREAQNIGAVNCVKLVGGRRLGYNTDVDGIRLSLDKLLNGDAVEAALVLGTGGASQAVQYVLAERAIPYQLVSRDSGKGNLTYDELSREVIAMHRLIINASPVGMYPHEDQAPKMPYDALTPNHYLFDLVYNPTTTLFMKKGAEYGANTLSGLDMLYAQAEAAWKIWRE